jgi:hypothetical protein
MRTGTSLITAVVTGVLAAGAAGCGGGDGPASGGSTPTGAAQPAPSVTLTFGPEGLTPAVPRVTGDASGRLDLTLVSGDGRPHAAAITVAGRRTRIVVIPGAPQRRLLTGVVPGRYRVVPDGAAEPATVLVGR